VPGGGTKTEVVRSALEDRAVPQNPEVGLQGRTIASAHGIALGQPHRDLLHSGVADILDDNDQPDRSIRDADVGVDPA